MAAPRHSRLRWAGGVGGSEATEATFCAVVCSNNAPSFVRQLALSKALARIGTRKSPAGLRRDDAVSVTRLESARRAARACACALPRIPRLPPAWPMGGTPGSPTPVGRSVLGTMWTSTCGEVNSALIRARNMGCTMAIQHPPRRRGTLRTSRRLLSPVRIPVSVANVGGAQGYPNA